MKKKLKTAGILLLYIALTVGLYALICYFIKRPFDDLQLVYAILIGCVAYLPRFIAEKRKSAK